MASLVDRNREPSAGELRWFGALFLGFWVVVAGATYARSGRTTGPLLLVGAALALTLLYYAVPQLRRSFLRAWVNATYPIEWTFSHLALGAFFYLILTPVGLLLRLFGRDVLQRRPSREQASYWIERAPRASAKHYWHQY